MNEKLAKEGSLLKKLRIAKSSTVALVSPKFELGETYNFEGHLGVAATPAGLDNLDQERLDTILVWVETGENLKDLLSNLKTYIKANGCIWAIIRKKSAYQKAERKEVAEKDITTAAKEAGLIEKEIVSISPTEYALGLTIPQARRVRV